MFRVGRMITPGPVPRLRFSTPVRIDPQSPYNATWDNVVSGRPGDGNAIGRSELAQILRAYRERRGRSHRRPESVSAVQARIAEVLKRLRTEEAGADLVLLARDVFHRLAGMRKIHRCDTEERRSRTCYRKMG